MALIFGIGVGLFILIVLWTITILLSLLFTRTDKLRPAAGGLFVLATLVTVILTLYPREGATTEPADIVVTDETFWGRVAMLAGLSLFTMLCLVFLFVFHWTESIEARPLKAKRY
ncbi:transmembrane protein 218-like [Apostichopus japonicus]|uniref:transmembrane protein 218-like n=1 Tax=Stichopus japonicus TaxID=307972 RepID=UPI003AB5BBF3